MTKQKPDTDQCICTVLLISYNHEPYIRLAIESVLAQKTKYENRSEGFLNWLTKE